VNDVTKSFTAAPLALAISSSLDISEPFKHRNSSTLTPLFYTMNSSRFALRTLSRQYAVPVGKRPFSVCRRACFKAETDHVTPQAVSPNRTPENVDAHREIQKNRSLNPHMTNTNSANHNVNEVPSVGADKAPPEFISSIDGDYTPKDSHPENTDRMTGGTQPGNPDNVSSPSEYGVGEMEGAKFRIEPIRRTGEDASTMRARLLCPYTQDYPLLLSDSIHKYGFMLT